MTGQPQLDIALPFQGTSVNNTDRQIKTEKEILLAVAAGDREAYQGIISRYMHSAYYIALGFVHNHQDALDISQDAFIRAFRKIKKFDPSRPFFPWFYRLMKNLCLDHIRKVKRLNEVPFEDVKILKHEEDDREMKSVLRRGIETLPVDQKEIIILRYFRQYTYKEIAEVTGKPEGTIMSTLFYAKKKLKAKIKEFLEEKQ